MRRSSWYDDWSNAIDASRMYTRRRRPMLPTRESIMRDLRVNRWRDVRWARHLFNRGHHPVYWSRLRRS